MYYLLLLYIIVYPLCLWYRIYCMYWGKTTATGCNPIAVNNNNNNNNQNRWVYGLCPSSGILSNYKTMFRKLGLFLSSGEGRETPTLLGPSKRANLSQWWMVTCWNCGLWPLKSGDFTLGLWYRRLKFLAAYHNRNVWSRDREIWLIALNQTRYACYMFTDCCNLPECVLVVRFRPLSPLRDHTISYHRSLYSS
jgi:hypothetical protein